MGSLKRERDDLLGRVKRLAVILKRDFGVKKVLLFGSLVTAPGFASGADVDLAVEGLEMSAYWRALELADGMIRDHAVYFIALESVSDSLRQSIERYGVEQ